jgi:transglutaminase-like putative cysteine protease
MIKFLEETNIIDYSNNEIQKLSAILALNCAFEIEIAKSCFEYVRDYIHHSGDEKNDITTCIASDVLKYKTGWCYSKSHLLAALLRANNIPTGFSYQRLSCSEYKEDNYCLHGLNAIYLKDYGWYRVDARGNKENVDAQFNPPREQLAFTLGKNEFDLPKIYKEPLDVVIKALIKHDTYSKMINNFPDIEINAVNNIELI